MTLPTLNFEELKEFLKSNGIEIISSQDWETHSRVMFGKDGQSFPLQIEGPYTYRFVMRLCKERGIEPPPEHAEVHQQLKALKKRDVDKEAPESEE